MGPGERGFPPCSLARSLFFLNVHGWGVLESWRKSCLCVALALSLSFSFAIHFCWSGLHAATLVKPSPSLHSGTYLGCDLCHFQSV